MAEIMKLDTKMDRLWRDKALVELNVAVLHSYNVRAHPVYIWCSYLNLELVSKSFMTRLMVYQ